MQLCKLQTCTCNLQYYTVPGLSITEQAILISQNGCQTEREEYMDHIFLCIPCHYVCINAFIDNKHAYQYRWTAYSEWFFQLHVVSRDQARECGIEKVLPGHSQHKANPLLSPEIIEKLSTLSEHGNLETRARLYIRTLHNIVTHKCKAANSIIDGNFVRRTVETFDQYFMIKDLYNTMLMITKKIMCRVLHRQKFIPPNTHSYFCKAKVYVVNWAW